MVVDYDAQLSARYKTSLQGMTWCQKLHMWPFTWGEHRCQLDMAHLPLCTPAHITLSFSDAASMKLDYQLLRTIFYGVTSVSKLTPVEKSEIRSHKCGSNICKVTCF